MKLPVPVALENLNSNIAIDYKIFNSFNTLNNLRQNLGTDIRSQLCETNKTINEDQIEVLVR